MSDAGLFVIAAILCAAFGGPLWATLTLVGVATLILVATLGD